VLRLSRVVVLAMSTSQKELVVTFCFLFVSYIIYPPARERPPRSSSALPSAHTPLLALSLSLERGGPRGRAPTEVRETGSGGEIQKSKTKMKNAKKSMLVIQL
jgi:hypothetical protein